MKKKCVLSLSFVISLLPMLLNQYGGKQGVQEITGLINLLSPIGILSVILFASAVMTAVYFVIDRKEEASGAETAG